MAKRATLIITGFVICAMFMGGCGSCGGGGNPPSPPDPKASGAIWASFTIDGAAPGDEEVRTVRWTLTMLQATLADGQGRTAEIVLDKQYRSTSGGVFRIGYETFSGLRAGIWRISCASGSNWSAQCEKTVNAGTNTSVNFTQFEVGCN